MNKVIIYLILSDVLILSAFGLIAPIFAIFLDQGISGGSIAAAGLASAIFLLTKSVVQLPLSLYLDKKKGKMTFLIVGTLLIVIVPIFYAISPNINFIFWAQGIYGLGAAMAYPAWYSLFTMHLDRKHRGFEYSLWATSVGIATAITAFLGARGVEMLGFRNLFYIVSGIGFVGLVILISLTGKFLKDIRKTERAFVNKFKCLWCFPHAHTKPHLKK